MTTTYTPYYSINYRIVFMAVAVSIALHVLLVVVFSAGGNTVLYAENGVRAYDAPRISIVMSQMPEPETKEITPDLSKVIPVKAPIVKKESIQTPAVKSSVTHITQNDVSQQAIPVIENATLKGKRTPPSYPKRALMLKQQGVVMLQALIDIDGKIKDIKVTASSGYAILDRSAIEAVRKWDFEPSYIDGKRLLSWVKVPVEFLIR